jgi:SAM-dependent methyltransferase
MSSYQLPVSRQRGSGQAGTGVTRNSVERRHRGWDHQRIMAKLPQLYEDLSFNSPLSNARAARLVSLVGPLAGAHVVDIGCGWAEFLLRAAAADPTVTALGLDADPDAIAHARAEATARGLADRADLRVTDASSWRPDQPVDVAICIGASHALGGIPQALAHLRTTVDPGGRLIFGEGIWERPPTPAALAALGGDPDEYGTLPDLVDLAITTGWRPHDIAVATLQEWDAFESGYSRGWERWLAANPTDPEAPAIRTEADTHRNHYLRGYRTILGFAYLVLA